MVDVLTRLWFGKVTAGMMLGDVTAGYPCLVQNEAAWDNLRQHAPTSDTLLYDIYDKLDDNAKLHVNLILHHVALVFLKSQQGPEWVLKHG